MGAFRSRKLLWLALLAGVPAPRQRAFVVGTRLWHMPAMGASTDRPRPVRRQAKQAELPKKWPGASVGAVGSVNNLLLLVTALGFQASLETGELKNALQYS